MPNGQDREPTAEEMVVCAECSKKAGRKVYVDKSLLRPASSLPWSKREDEFTCPAGHTIKVSANVPA